MDISILIATYKREALLRKTLESLCAQDTDGFSWEIIVVDNTTGDELTRSIIESYNGKVPVSYYVEWEEGKSSALNLAMSKAKGDLFVFTDDDVVADKDWLKEIWQGASRWPGYSVLGGRILPRSPENTKLEYLDSKYCRLFYAIADWDRPEGPYSPYDVYGPNFAVRSGIFKEEHFKFHPDIGPKGKDYIMGCETQLLLRLKEAGYIPVYLPKAVVYHQIREEQTHLEWFKERAYRGGKSSAYMDGRLNVPKLWGVPRYLVREYLEKLLEYIVSFWMFDKVKKLNKLIRFEFVKGKIAQHKIGEFYEG